MHRSLQRGEAIRQFVGDDAPTLAGAELVGGLRDGGIT